MIIEINKNVDLVSKICIESLESLGIEIDEIDSKENIIFGSTKGGLLSWGEDIRLELKIIDSKKTSIKIFSEAKAQLISWGKNDKNITYIYDTIKKVSKEY